MRSFTIASLLFVLCLAFAIPTYASGEGQTGEVGFGISPVSAADATVTANGYFIFKVKGSTNVTGSVMLKNPGNLPVEIQLGAVDALTAQKGGSAFATSAIAQTGAAKWLRFAETSVTLPAGRQQPVEFTVSVPPGLKPGQYLTGISAYVLAPEAPEQVSQSKNQMGAQVNMQMRYIIGVEVDIEGNWTPALEIENVNLIQQPLGPFIGVQLKNSGAAFLTPSGTIVMTDTAGDIVLDQPIKMGTFVPGTSVVYPINWSGVMAAGMYQVHVVLNYGESGIEIYDGPLEIANEKALQSVQDNNIKAQEPGTIGSASPVEPATQVQLNQPTVQVQGQGEMWIWVSMAVSIGSMLLALAGLIVLNKARQQKMQAVSKGE